jgi:hypothetical protein
MSTFVACRCGAHAILYWRLQPTRHGIVRVRARNRLGVAYFLSNTEGFLRSLS